MSTRSQLPVWALASASLLLVIGVEAFVFGVLVVIPSAFLAEGIGKTVGVSLAKMALAAAWIAGFAVYAIQRLRQNAWLAIVVFTVVTLILFNTNVDPIINALGAYAMIVVDKLVSLLGGSSAYAGLVMLMVYSIVAPWMVRALERMKTSLLLSAAIAVVLAQGLSTMTLVVGNELVKSLSGLGGVAGTVVVFAIVLAMMRDAAAALRRWDPALLVQLPLMIAIIRGAGFTEIANIFAILTYALTVFAAGFGLAFRSRRLLITASVIIGAFGPVVYYW